MTGTRAGNNQRSVAATLMAALASAFATACAIRDAVRRETRPTPEQAELALAKARMSGANLDEGMRTMPFAALALAATYCMWHPVWLAGLWLAAFAGVWLLHWMINGVLAEATQKTARSALRLYRLENYLFVAVWISQAWLFWVPGDPVNHMVVTAVILASTMGAVMAAAWAPTAVVQIIGYLGTAIVLFVLEGGTVDLMMAGLAVVFGVFVGGTSAHLHQTTERMLTLEADKDKLIDSLRAADRAKSEFLANMSHELRTPLNAILGFSEVMKLEVLGPLGSAKYRNYAGDIHTSGAHLLSLINDILDLAKIEAGKVELRDDLFRISQLAEMTVGLFHVQTEQAGITIASEIGPDPLIRFDLRSAKQIAFNLVANAVKFTPPGGSITVGTATGVDGWLRISIRDTGCGIAPEDQGRVFQSFGQGRHDVALTQKGTGLGLPIVLGLVQLHGGQVELDSAPGKGTTVTICIPPDRQLEDTAATALQSAA
jgi:two-component system cell cycle sensor histidine kinase PleC